MIEKSEKSHLHSEQICSKSSRMTKAHCCTARSLLSPSQATWRVKTTQDRNSVSADCATATLKQGE